jgi:hypothetical protein
MIKFLARATVAGLLLMVWSCRRETVSEDSRPAAPVAAEASAGQEVSDAGRSVGVPPAPVLSPAAAGLREQRLTASDGAAFDHLGFSVAGGDGVVVTGARFADAAGVDSGAVYVFRRGPAGWRQEVKLVAADAHEHDRFGNAVAIDGDTLVVGAHAHHELGRRAGSAYVFRYRGGAWRQEAKLRVAEAARFGHAVAVSGDRVLVGAPGDPVGGQPAGAVYVFRRRGSSWQREGRLTAGDAAAYDLFGGAVAASGDTVLVGAPGDDERGSLTGAAYIFRNDGAGWRQGAKLLAEDAYALYELGKTVALDGDTAVVGAEGAGDVGKFAGAAYVFHRLGDAWQQEAKLLATDRRPADRFGNAVAIHGDTAAIGAHFADAAGLGSGTGYLFRRRDGQWRQEAKLAPSGAAAGEEFGNALSIFGGTVAVGALRSGSGGFAAGSVSIFENAETAK